LYKKNCIINRLYKGLCLKFGGERDMKNIILYNSRKLFYETGYFKTKISDITKKSGVSTGNFYRYYDSKKELLSEIIKNDVKIYKDDLLRSLPEEGDDILKLKMIIRSIFIFLKKNPFFFTLLIELEENDRRLLHTTKKCLNSFWYETKAIVIDVLKFGEHFKKEKEKEKILLSIMEIEIKLYIRYLLSEKNGKCQPEKLMFLPLENDINAISDIIVNTFKSLNGIATIKNIDPLTGAYTNNYFFELLKKNHDNKKSFNLIFLSLEKIYNTENTQKIFFKDSIIKNIVESFRKKFRPSDLIGRLDPCKFMLLLFTEVDMEEEFESRMIKIVEELQVKFRCISPEDIIWKNLYIDSKDDVFNRFKEIKSIKYNNINNLTSIKTKNKKT